MRGQKVRVQARNSAVSIREICDACQGAWSQPQGHGLHVFPQCPDEWHLLLHFQHRRMHWLCGRLQGSECICLSFGFLSIKQTLSCQKLVAGRFWKTLMTRKGRNEGSGSRSLSWRNCEVILSQAHVVNTSGSVLWKYIHPSPACQE